MNYAYDKNSMRLCYGCELYMSVRYFRQIGENRFSRTCLHCVKRRAELALLEAYNGDQPDEQLPRRNPVKCKRVYMPTTHAAPVATVRENLTTENVPFPRAGFSTRRVEVLDDNELPGADQKSLVRFDPSQQSVPAATSAPPVKLQPFSFGKKLQKPVESTQTLSRRYYTQLRTVGGLESRTRIATKYRKERRQNLVASRRLLM